MFTAGPFPGPVDFFLSASFCLPKKKIDFPPAPLYHSHANDYKIFRMITLLSLFTGRGDSRHPSKNGRRELPFKEVERGAVAVVRLKDVAEACGVSVATVSRALNGRCGENKERAAYICRTARTMGYFPNAAAKTLKTSRSNNIGILYEDRMDHEYFSAMMEAIRRNAELRGYDLTFIRREVEKARDAYYEHARRRNLDGVIVIQADFDSAGVIRLATSSIPTVIIDHIYEGCDCVSNDNRSSVEELVRYARGKGHRALALIQGERGAVSQERLAGFYKACAELGIRVPSEYVRSGRFHDPAGCYAHLRSLLSLPEPPTCVLCPDDFSCLGALWQMKAAGIRVPEDVSLVGFDGLGADRMTGIRPTTCRQDYETIAAEAIGLLLDAIERPDAHVPRQITVPGCLLEGDTVSEPPAL